MNKSITQDNQNDNQISKSIRRFFTRFHLSSALKSANAYKKKGIPAALIFQYLFLLIFSNRSMYMNLLIGKDTPDFAKDTVYRFMKMLQINWIRFTTILSSRIIRDAIAPLDSADRANVLIIDDSMFERNRSKKVELLAKAYDHAKHCYKFGFRMLTLGWSEEENQLSKRTYLAGISAFLADFKSSSMAIVPFSTASIRRLYPTVLLSTSFASLILFFLFSVERRTLLTGRKVLPSDQPNVSIRKPNL